MVICIFPNEQSCLSLIQARLVEMNEDYFVGGCYLDMLVLKEYKKIKSNTLENAA